MATKAAATGGRRWRGDDFPAWLSPMLVKELRQGIQSGAFAWTFVALQIAMVVLFVFWVGSVSADDTTRAGSFYRGVFWLLLGVACVFVLPLRGLQAVKSEEAGQTFDLLRLTRLTSTQIVVGKWLAIVAQIGLITVAVLPYVVLQYFLGGYAVIDDLLFVAGLVVVGGVVTAAAIAASNQPQWIRATLGVGMGLLVTYAAGGAGMFFGMFGLTASGTLLAVEVLFGGMVVLVLLEYAAAGIAPRAENHALRKRLLATAMVALAVAAIALQATYVAAGRIPPWGSVGVVAALVALQSLVATWIMVAELLTDPVRLRVIYEPFARRGAIGRALATLLTPGWATALPLAMLFAAAWVTMLPAFVRVVGGTPPAGAGTLRWYSLVGVAAVLFPVPFTRFVKAGPMRALVYALATMITIVPLILFQQRPAWQRASLATRVLEGIVAALPAPALIHFDPSFWSQPMTALLPLLSTAIVWAPMAIAWGRAMTDLRSALRACGAARPGTAAVVPTPPGMAPPPGP